MTMILQKKRGGRAAALAVAVSILAAGPVAAAPAFVGCPSDGQMGPVAAPKRAPKGVAVPAGLALYGSDGLLTAAPAGWHCACVYGSNGALLIVVPGRIAPNDLIGTDTTITGPVVMVRRINGGTSGRFEAADVAAQVFPSAAKFVEDIRREAAEIEVTLPTGPVATDTITRRSAELVEYTTPAGRTGLGTVAPVAAAGRPIRGAAVLLPAQDMDVVQLVVRLDTAAEPLGGAIVEAFERDFGSWPQKGGAKR